MTKPTPTTSNIPKAYSYVRFSTPDQMKGDSFRRQIEAGERYAATHGLDLDTKFSFHDLGVSAFQGRNRAEGMLGEFLAYVKAGDIPKGSYLLVENLDRVSRENALDALDALRDIAREGITVVTLSDGREYTYEGIRRDFTSLILALMTFARANEESEIKARRLKAAWEGKRRAAADKPLTALCPAWMRLRDDRSGYDLIPERASVVRRVFSMTLEEGKGQHAIAETFNREGVPVFGRGRMWHRTYIAKMLADPAVIGTFTPHRIERTEGKKVRIPTDPIEGYFPAVIDRETFDKVAALTSGRSAMTKASGGVANILAGLAKCPHCGSTMTRVNKGSGKKAGKPYLVCTAAKARRKCEYRQVRLERIEEAILEKAEMLLVEMPSPDQQIQIEWERLQAAEAAVDYEIENVVAAIAAAGHSPALLDRLRENEAAREQIREQLKEAENSLADTLTNRVQETVARLVDAAVADPVDVPMINATMRQLFDRVVVDYSTGYLQFHWRHAPSEVSSFMFEWPKD